MGLEEEGHFPGPEGKTFQEQIYGTSNFLLNQNRLFFFFSRPSCRDLESQHTKTSALPVMAKVTSSLTILVAGELVGDWIATQLQ